MGYEDGRSKEKTVADLIEEFEARVAERMADDLHLAAIFQKVKKREYTLDLNNDGSISVRNEKGEIVFHAIDPKDAISALDPLAQKIKDEF